MPVQILNLNKQRGVATEVTLLDFPPLVLWFLSELAQYGDAEMTRGERRS
jgi:hypothetical protein